MVPRISYRRLSRSLVILLLLLFSNTRSIKAEEFDTSELRYYIEILSAIQGNFGTHSQLTSCPSRFRLYLEKQLFSNSVFTGRLTSYSGKYYLGGSGEFVPVNDIAPGNRPNILLLDRADLIISLSKTSEIDIGLLDLDELNRMKTGLSYNRGVMEEDNGFLSTHMLRHLAASYLEQTGYSTIPAIALTMDTGKTMRYRFLLTSGDIENHIFFRNTWGIEATFRNRLSGLEGEYTISLGFADAEDSNTHHVSPCMAFDILQQLSRSLTFFSRISFAEDHTVSRMFTDVQEHFNAGFTIKSKKSPSYKSGRYLGIGFSSIKVFDMNIREKMIECFYRMPLNKYMTLTPDLQGIINPRGTGKVNEEFLLIWALRLSARF